MDCLKCVGSEPSGIEVLNEGVVTVGEVAEVAVHREVKVGIVVLNGGKVAVYHDVGVHLFVQFADEGLFVTLARL